MFIDKSVFIPGLSNISKSISRIKARGLNDVEIMFPFKKSANPRLSILV